MDNVTLADDDGDTMTIDDGKLKLKCNSTGVFPTPAWPNCTEVGGASSSGRKKRSSERYSHLQDDIDYTILVMVETQFMWTDGIENEINIIFNCFFLLCKKIRCSFVVACSVYTCILYIRPS